MQRSARCPYFLDNVKTTDRNLPPVQHQLFHPLGDQHQRHPLHRQQVRGRLHHLLDNRAGVTPTWRGLYSEMPEPRNVNVQSLEDMRF